MSWWTLVAVCLRKPDEVTLPRLLRPGGERRGEDAEGEGDDEHNVSESHGANEMSVKNAFEVRPSELE